MLTMEYLRELEHVIKLGQTYLFPFTPLQSLEMKIQKEKKTEKGSL